MKTILITGATGYIGRRLTHQLVRSSKYNIRLFVRNRSKVQKVIGEAVDVREGSTFNPETLDAALEGVDTAFYLIHSMGREKDYQQLDRKSAVNFADSCIRAGVKRIIYLGGLGQEKDGSKHLLSRLETGKILSDKPDAVQTVWLRAGVIIGSGSSSFEIIRHLVHKLPLILTPSWVRTQTQPIGIDDVLAYLAASIELEYGDNLVVDIGSEQLSFKQMMEKSAEIMGLKRILIPVPFLSPHFSSYWLMLFTPVPFKLASALVEGLKSETLCTNDNARQYYPHIRPLSFGQAVQGAMTELARNHVLSRWCDSSGGKACDIKDFKAPAGTVFRDVRIVAFNNDENQQEVFQAACSLGGEHGWFKYNVLWRIRGFLDKLIGGYGLNRGRRVNRELRVGDALDFWKVADIKEGKRLLLYAQMKLPGQAWLEFDVQPNQLVQTAHFIPKGLRGRLYWYIILPVHYFVFPDLAGNIVKGAREKKK